MVWVSSLGTELVGEKSYGLSLDYLNYWPALTPLERYGVSKAGNWLHGVEFARRYQAEGVVSVPCNPGHLRSDLYRESGIVFRTMLNLLFTYPSINGAYTEIFAGLSPEITMRESGEWGEFFVSLLYSLMYRPERSYILLTRETNTAVVPWGRLHPIRQDLLDATKTEAEGGNGHAKTFWEWTEDQVRSYG